MSRPTITNNPLDRIPDLSVGEMLPPVGNDYTVNNFHLQVKKRIAEDVAVRRNTFLARESCSTEKSSALLPLAHSCALKLKVDKLAKNSRNMDYLNDRLERDMQEMRDLTEWDTDFSQKKIILLWNSDAIRDGPLRICPVCELAKNKHLFSPEKIDAIVVNSFLVWKNKNDTTLPTRQMFPNAKMVIYEYEPIQRSGSLLMEGLVDYTFGYRRDSDIVKTNGYIFPREQPTDISQLLAKNAKKTKMVAWMVSNCFAPSMRLKLAETLQRHGVKVDIYGQCGNLKCPKKDDSCMEMVKEHYKFYLSFENTLCNHYVTEKFYRTLTLNLVPITYGLGLELTGAPKDSYIDVFDFVNAKSLAEYIIYLDSNITAYNEYFKWKEYYEVIGETRNYAKMCQLCKTLVENSPPASKYKNGEYEVWVKDGQCIDVKNNTRIWNFVSGLPENES